MDDIKMWVSVLQFLFMVWWARFTWTSARGQASAAEVNDLKDRVLRLEEQYRHMPDQKLVQQLAVNMGVIRAELEGVRNELRPLAKSMDRINDFLLAHK